MEDWNNGIVKKWNDGNGRQRKGNDGRME